MVINDAAEIAKCICNHNPKSVLVALHPVQHAAIDRAFVLRHRREVEDLFQSQLPSRTLEKQLKTSKVDRVISRYQSITQVCGCGGTLVAVQRTATCF